MPLEPEGAVVFHLRGIEAGSHGQYSRQGQGLAAIDGANVGVGVRAEQDPAVDHARRLHIAHILQSPGDLGNRVIHRDRRPDTLSVRRRGDGQQQSGRPLDRPHDLDITGAPAEVVSQCRGDLRLCRTRGLLQQGHAPDHHSRRAETALDGPHLHESLLYGMQGIAAGQSLDSGHRLSVQVLYQDRAGVDGLAVQQNLAGAAITGPAAALGPRQGKAVPQKVQQGLAGIRFSRPYASINC